MKITIHYSDGLYGWREAENDTPPGLVTEVPDEVVALWRQADELLRVVQQQLLKLDNELFERNDTQPQTQENGDARRTESETEEG